ncbi:GNAT family N-acetyltransferase [Kutzneria albida]|uniref:GNAT family N-acetyltransferase n=1 Tax=Kutzneria albida TaxID=43357 RepID=UPI00046D8C6A|nr:GNAT family N-acetyltransferase [Kutzneria albida]
MQPRVRLEPVNDHLVERLLALAVAEAEPEDVMPAVPAGPGWPPLRHKAFRAFHRKHFDGLGGVHRTQMYAVLSEDSVVGMIRMSRLDEPGVVETGMWLGRGSRGRGLGAAALAALLAEAERAGVRRVVARTTADNAAALGALSGLGARLRAEGGAVHAEFELRAAG